MLIRRRAEDVVTREVAKRGGLSGGVGRVAPHTTVAADPGVVVVVDEGTGGREGGASAPVASDGVGSATATPGGATSAESAVVPASSTATDPPEPLAASSSAQRSESDVVIPPPDVDALQQLQQQISLDPSLAPSLSLPGSGTAHHRGGRVFNLAAERSRRAQLDRLGGGGSACRATHGRGAASQAQEGRKARDAGRIGDGLERWRRRPRHDG